MCKHGWSMQPDLGGCVDIDECATVQNTCTKNQFCVNSEGSYSCLGEWALKSILFFWNGQFNLVNFQSATNRASVVVVMVLTYVINVPMDLN